MFNKDEIDAFVLELTRHFNDFDSSEAGRYNATIRCFEDLIGKYGTESYNFNYITERLAELYCSKIKNVLSKILDDYILKIDDINYNEHIASVAFTAYYTLSLILKKEEDMIGLEKLSGDAYYLPLRRFPLIFEVRARYRKRIGDYSSALRSDQEAIRILKKKKIDNPAVMISFASTVSMICESGNIFNLRKSEIDEALDYIECALKYNPTYPKYYYLKGKLIYYKNRGVLNFSAFLKECEKAKSFVEEAKDNLDPSSEHYFNEMDLYDELITFIDNEIAERVPNETVVHEFKDLTPEDIKKMKEDILKSGCAQDCRPEKPSLKQDQKYIFISYSTNDYKSVYCDLVELYAKKIPFDYDEALTHGKNWELQIKDKINNENCIGVIFYLSSSVVLSEAIEKEINMMKQRFGNDFEENCFWVNLDRKYSPFKLVLKAIKDNEVSQLMEKGFSPSRLITYLQTFDDASVFTEKSSKADSSKHINTLVRSIEEKFPTLFENQ